MVEISQDTNLHWYAIYTRSKCEKVVSNSLSESFEIYLPMRWVKRRWSDRYKKLLQPLIPNYVFIKMQPKSRIKVLSNINVLTIVNQKGQPIAIPEKDLELVRKIESSKIPFEYTNISRRFSPGEKVEIIDGAFFGVEGEIEAILNRNWVSIQIPSIGGRFKTRTRSLTAHQSSLSIGHAA